MQKQLRRPSSRTEEVVDQAPTPERSDTLSGIDAILDEIDEVLESNAEAFVKAYVQRGGE